MKQKINALFLTATMIINLSAVKKQDVQQEQTMVWQDYINTSLTGNLTIKIDGQYLWGNIHSGLVYFPDSIESAQKNWNEVLSQEARKLYKEFWGKDYSERSAEYDNKHNFGIKIKLPKGIYSEGILQGYRSETEEIFSYNDVIYWVNKQDHIVYKSKIDLNEIQRTTKKTKKRTFKPLSCRYTKIRSRRN